ncbi:MAG: oxidoreductase [Planctomycetia bacterium]|nr:oxidoreductase [Planctomycetia bacterium]
MDDIRLVTLDPGHFHAALVQKEMYTGVARRTHVYAPFGPDLLAHLQRLNGFNTRAVDPTHWEVEVHGSDDYLDRFQRERPGNVAVLSGRNRRKLDYLEAAVAAGLHVLADKPWVLRDADLPRLRAVLELAERNRLIAYDIMTERYEITSIFQRELVRDREVFGKAVPGDEKAPGVFMESVHYLRKQVAGSPLRRPPWFFDIHEEGEGLSDVGTHLVDLVMWILYPDQAIDVERDVELLAARRWATELTRAQFREVTGETDFPAFLADRVDHGRLAYYCNNFVAYQLRGVHVQLNVLWDYEAAGGSDTHLAGFRGSRASIEVRQGAAEQFRPELYVVPADSAQRAVVCDALQRRVADWQQRWPGVAVEELADRFAVRIPDRYRVGHEAHFAEVTRQFLHYLNQQQSLPSWEKPNMVAKYHVTTRGVALAQ